MLAPAAGCLPRAVPVLPQAAHARPMAAARQRPPQVLWSMTENEEEAMQTTVTAKLAAIRERAEEDVEDLIEHWIAVADSLSCALADIEEAWADAKERLEAHWQR